MIGKRIYRVDSREKVTGKAIYGIDMRVPGMLPGKILRSPLPHARILHMDTTKARRLKGVKAVVTAEDTPKIKYGAQIDDEYPLALGKVRFIGDEVAAVAAVDEETAREALDLIRVEYEELPAVFSPREAMAAGAPQIHESANNIATHLEFERGSVAAGFREADYILEDTFITSNVHQGYLEPHVCVAQVDADGRITLWASLQAPARNRDQIAKILNLPVSRIRIIQTTVGGGFGGKSTQVISLYPICALLALKAGTPVRLVNTWEDEFAASRSRMPGEIRLKLGIKRDGTFTAKEMEILAGCGAYAGTGPVRDQHHRDAGDLPLPLEKRQMPGGSGLYEYDPHWFCPGLWEPADALRLGVDHRHGLQGDRHGPAGGAFKETLSAKGTLLCTDG